MSFDTFPKEVWCMVPRPVSGDPYATVVFYTDYTYQMITDNPRNAIRLNSGNYFYFCFVDGRMKWRDVGKNWEAYDNWTEETFYKHVANYRFDKDLKELLAC